MKNTDTPTDTPETDAKMFGAWKWDTHKMDYVPHGVGVPAEYARKLERERNEYRTALEQIRANPGWQDPEVGFMAGHIAAGALNLFLENTKESGAT